MSAPERGPRWTWQYLALWDGGAMALGATRAALPKDDRSAAGTLAAENAGGLNFAQGTGQWYVWDGRCHAPDQAGQVRRVIVHFTDRLLAMLDAARQQISAGVAARMPADASEAAIRREIDKLWKDGWEQSWRYAARLRSNAGKESLRGYLETVCGVSDEDMAEHHPGLLNVANGTLNLATLELSPHRIGDRITYCLPDPWKPGARCPRFLEMVRRMCGGDDEVTWYLLKLLGYSLLGDNREQRVIFINGPTGSGKSQVLYCVGQVLGPLAHAAQSDLICVVRHGRNARTENSVRGKRFISITETSQFMNIDEAQLKRLTGEPVISVDQHYSRVELKTPVTWLIFVATNQMPTLTNYDTAMRRRIIVIPGGASLREWEVDPQISAKILSAERAGILALLAKGCAEYHRSGIRDVPDAVRAATEEYAAEQNTVATFVMDTMVLGGWSAEGGIPQHQAWQMYEQWSRGQSRLGRNEFMDHLGKYPGVSWNKVSRRFEGVAWNATWAIVAG